MNIEMFTWGGAIASGGAEAPVTLFEASKLVLFARKQTKRSAKIGVFQESGSKKYHQLNLGNHKFSGER